MKLEIVPIDFRPTDNGLVPMDGELYTMAMEFCRENLVALPDFTEQRKTYVVAEFGPSERPLKIHAVSCGRPVFDIGVVRAVGPFAKQCLAMIGQRWNSYLSDQGFRGHQAFVWIDDEETLEQQCPNRQATIEAFDLKPSKRMAGRVR